MAEEIFKVNFRRKGRGEGLSHRLLSRISHVYHHIRAEEEELAKKNNYQQCEVTSVFSYKYWKCACFIMLFILPCLFLVVLQPSHSDVGLN